MASRAYYPLFADLEGKRCIVVGGGLVAQRKVTTLLKYGAAVTVVSPTVTARLGRSANAGTICLIQRRFQPQDLAGAWLAYAATDDRRTNQLVFRSAMKRRLFANVVDDAPLCSFIAPAIVRRGALVVAVSTGGASPSLAKKVRTDVGRALGHDYVPMVRLLAGLRAVAKNKLPAYRDRKRYFDRLVHGRVFTLVKAGKTRQAKRTALTLLEQETGTNGAR